MSHSQSVVNTEERVVPPDKTYERDVKKYVMMPASAIGRHVAVEEREKRLSKDASSLPVNREELRDNEIGFITSGVPYQYVREAFPQASVLKLGIINPLPIKLIEDFAYKTDRRFCRKGQKTLCC